jgi:F-type H+-transporting ATPase subunit gamma
MASLKDLKNRIKSVKSTQKITKAMKMVAAAKLRRAQEHAESARPYAEKMAQVVTALAVNAEGAGDASVLLNGTGDDKNHLLLVMTSDRGLCGGFNSSIVRSTKKHIRDLQAQGKQVSILCVGRKGYEQLRGDYGHLIVGRVTDMTKRKLNYTDAQYVSDQLFSLFKEHKIDVVTMVYNHFKSAIAQVVTYQQLIPLAVEEAENGEAAASDSVYEYEPDEETILSDLLPRNITMQCFKALLESSASEHGARMTAMDNATRNAGDMIDKLSLVYNRTRQAAITTELTEIISGAEAV